MSSSPLLRRTGAALAVSAVALVAASPAHAIDGVGGDGVTSARDQYDAGPDATAADTRPAGAAGTTGAASPTRKPDRGRDRGRERDRTRDDGSGVLGDGAGGRQGDGGDGAAADPGGSGVLGDGAQGATADPGQAQRQLRQGTDLPFTGWTLAPVALLGAGLLGAGIVLRRRSRDV